MHATSDGCWCVWDWACWTTRESRRTKFEAHGLTSVRLLRRQGRPEARAVLDTRMGGEAGPHRLEGPQPQPGPKHLSAPQRTASG